VQLVLLDLKVLREQLVQRERLVPLDQLEQQVLMHLRLQQP
jgi:hypothetical protein